MLSRLESGRPLLLNMLFFYDHCHQSETQADQKYGVTVVERFRVWKMISILTDAEVRSHLLPFTTLHVIFSATGHFMSLR